MKNISLHIDFNPVIKEFQLNKTETDNMVASVIKNVSNAIESQWKSEANKSLKTTKDGYIKNLNVIEEGRLKNSIVLSGTLYNMLESGFPSFDMKVGFLNSSKVKTSAKGTRYITIPVSKEFSKMKTDFRRVSINSKSDSWIHPGLEARNFAEAAIEKIDFNTLVENSIDKYLSNR